MKDSKRNSPNDTKVEVNSPEPRMATPADASKRISPSKSPPIESVRQYIKQIYADPFKRKRIRRSDMKRMREKPALNDDEIKELVKQTSKDRDLKRTFYLTTVGAEIESSNVSDQIGKFVQETLKNHPAFKGRRLEGSVDNVMHLITDPEHYEYMRWPDDDFKLEGNAIKECRANALHCFLRWLWMTKRISIEHVQDYLLKYKWKPSVQPSKTDAEKVILLTSARDPETMAISTEVLHKEAADQKKRAESAENENEHSIKQVQLLKIKLEKVQLLFSDTNKKVDSLEKKLLKEHQEHTDDIAYLKDDYETLRGQVLRRLSAELALLDEGLHALQRIPPKVNVMVDHAERAIDGLRTEYERLQKRGES